jgi:hypothetical protein
MGSYWDAVVGQDLPDAWGRYSLRTVVVRKPGIGRSFVRLFPRNCVLEMLQNVSVDGMIYCLALGNKFVMHQTLHTKEGDQH